LKNTGAIEAELIELIKGSSSLAFDFGRERFGTNNNNKPTISNAP